MRRLCTGLGMLCSLAACGPKKASLGDDSTTTSSSASESTTADNPESSSEDTRDPPSETVAETETETGCAWEQNGDSFGPGWCDMIWQDCPEGEKCVPFSWGPNDRAFKCVPVTGDGVPGEPCTFGGRLEATDDCNVTSFCAGYDENDLGGTCHPFCTDLEAPQCIEGWGCALPDEDPYMCELPAYCVPLCDPLADNCEAGSVCAWTNSTFSCANEGAGAPIGEPCLLSHDCASGLACMTSEALTGCSDDSCCAPFCSVSAGNGPCQPIDPNYVCEPFFMQMQAPTGYEDLGVCVLAA